MSDGKGGEMKLQKEKVDTTKARGSGRKGGLGSGWVWGGASIT